MRITKAVIQNDRFITKHSFGFGINRVTASHVGRKAVINMTIPEAIERLRVMTEPGQEQNNQAIQVAVEVMKQTQKRLEQERRTK